mgnify:CR=1 FL=1
MKGRDANYNAKKIHSFLKKYHKNNYFIKIAKFNTPIGTGDVINTNYCQISICENRKKNKVIIISAIDDRVNESYSVAGSFPIWLRSDSRDFGDYEQTIPEFYQILSAWQHLLQYRYWQR